MELADELRLSLKDHLGWSKPRVTCFVYLLLALIRFQHMNLMRLAVVMEGTGQISSRYRRLQRFFREVPFDYDALARLLMQSFGFTHSRYYLTLDRTNWQYGKRNLNFLVLGIVHKGIAVPVYWVVLNKRGNSNQRERIALLKRFITQFGSDQIEGVLGDREFIGKDWWHWLSTNKIPFLMRMKGNQHCTYKGEKRPVSHLFRKLKPSESTVLRKARHVSGQSVWLSALRLETGDLLILAGNQKQAKPFDIYGKRWEIETLFQALKGRGFHMEDTRMTHYFRIKKMMALLALGFCWAHKTGEWRNEQTPLRPKKHGRYEQSFFRYGLDYLTDQLHHWVDGAQDVIRAVLLLLFPLRTLEEVRDGKIRKT